MPLRLVALAWLAMQLGQHHVPTPALLLVCAIAALPAVLVGSKARRDPHE